MTQPLTSLVRIGTLLVACLGLWVAPSAAQDVSADVRTWSGESWRLAQPSLEIFYTIPAPAKGGGDGSYGAPPRPAPPPAPSQLSMSGPLLALEASSTRAPSRGRVTARPSTSPSVAARSRGSCRSRASRA